MRLHTFGGLSVRSGPVGAERLGRRPLALLAVLAVADGREVSRDKLIALLWPESDTERGRNSLSHALSALRRELAADLCIGTSDLRLNDQAISSDTREFERSIARGDLEHAASIYSGPFLDGVFLKDAPEFERWVEQQRARFHEMAVSALRQLAEQAYRRSDYTAAVRWWRSFAALEPTSAAGAVGLMRSLCGAADRPAALRHYQVYEALLQEDLSAEPDEEVVALAAELRLGRGSAAPAGEAPISPNYTHTASTHPPPTSVVTPHRRLRGGRAMLGLGVAGTIAILVALRAAGPISHDARRISVAGFANETGDSTLRSIGLLAANVVADGLQRAGIGEVTDEATAILTSAALEHSTSAESEAQRAASFAEAMHARFVVTGHFFRDGESLAVVARLTDASRKTVLGVTEQIRISARAPSTGLNRLQQRVLGIVASQFDERMEDVLPGGSSLPSLAAYDDYADGLREFQQQRFPEALRHFVRAYEQDSSFVPALMWQAFALGSTGNWPDRSAVVAEFARHRDRLTPLERHALAYFEAAARRDWKAALVALRAASSLAPASIWTYNVGNLLNGLGRSDEAAAAFAELETSHGWTSGWLTYWRQYARALHYVDHRHELRVIREARRVMPLEFAPRLNVDEARAQVALGNRDAVDSTVANLQSAPADGGGGEVLPGWVLHVIAMELWSVGDTAYSRRVLDRAISWFASLSPELRSRRAVRVEYANVLYDAGRWDDARSVFEQAVAERADDWDSVTELGLCLAHRGDRVGAESVLARLLASGDSADGGANLVVSGHELRAARIAAVLGDRDRAVALIRELNSRTGGLLSRHAMHKDFDGLSRYPPYRRVTAAWK